MVRLGIVHVGAGINATLWELWKSNLESLLNILQHLLIGFAGNEGDGNTLGSETSGTTDSV